MIETVCPQCATVNENDELTPHSENFCTECDFPLFWDQQAVAMLSSEERTDEALRRLPGVAGRDSRRMRPCPECAEPNQLVAVICIRCSSPMDPPPPPPEPVGPLTEEFVIVRRPPGRDWMLVVLVIMVMALTAGLVAYGISLS